jgi:hypothetical protein
VAASAANAMTTGRLSRQSISRYRFIRTPSCVGQIRVVEKPRETNTFDNNQRQQDFEKHAALIDRLRQHCPTVLEIITLPSYSFLVMVFNSAIISGLCAIG